MLKSGIILLVFGIVYLARPGIYSQGFWQSVIATQQQASPRNDQKFIRILGGVFVLAGLSLLAAGWLAD
jgi:hypothetical protein